MKYIGIKEQLRSF